MSTGATDPGADPAMGSEHRYLVRPGTTVRVRTRFDGGWSSGFEVADTIEEDPPGVRYRLRRKSDGVILPALFSDEDLAPLSTPT